MPPYERFSSFHCDLVGPLPPTSDDFQYLLTVTDRFTRHLEVILLKETTTKTFADAFLLHWVVRFGCPAELICDRGAQFTSHLWQKMCNFIGCRLNNTCSYRPQCNGMIKRSLPTAFLSLH